MVTHDAVVVGGSVAGSVAAREMALRGMRVALVEKARFPRPKACGEGLLPHGAAALAEMGLQAAGVRVRGIRYHSPSGIVAEADFPSGHGLVVRRERFDGKLFRAAAATPGVDAFEEAPYDPDRWPARWIVGADGIRSRFHGIRGLEAVVPDSGRAGLSAHLRGVRVDAERVEVFLHAGGEVYVAPSEDGDALVACLCRRGAMPAATTNEERMLAILSWVDALRPRLDAPAFTTPCLAAAPLGLRVSSCVAGNVVLVGDAAGAPDPVTGEGMALAILSARAAAGALAEGKPQRYAEERRRLAAGSDWLGRWILRAARSPAVADRVVGALARRPELLSRLLEVAVGVRREPGWSLADLVRLVA